MSETSGLTTVPDVRIREDELKRVRVLAQAVLAVDHLRQYQNHEGDCPECPEDCDPYRDGCRWKRELSAAMDAALPIARATLE